MQSVKSDGHGGHVGYGAGKRIKGRKRHLLVDALTLGLILGVAVTPANTTDLDGAQLLLGRVLCWFAMLWILWVMAVIPARRLLNGLRGFALSWPWRSLNIPTPPTG
jgi:putative transposase